MAAEKKKQEGREATAAEVKVSKAEVKTTASVYHPKTGALVRKYTEEVHGEDFAELAAEFAKKKGYEVR